MNPFRSAQQRPAGEIDVIPPDHGIRRGARKRSETGRLTDVVDAEFEVVRSARVARQAVVNDNMTRRSPAAKPVVPTAQPTQPIRAFAGIEDGLRMLPRKGFAGLSVFVCVCAFLAVYFYWPAQRTRVALASQDGLVITGLHQSPVDANGLRVIELTGIVENRSALAETIPAVIARLISDGHMVGKAAVSLGDKAIEPGTSASFFMRIPYPGGKSPKVTVSFAAKGV